MDIQKLHIENFLTIGNATLSLNNKGLVLVQGENKDDPSADSNGAGKSSIPDALCWALYGETARGVKGDAVVNKVIGKNCYIKVTIEDDGVFYFVERYRKHKTGKSRLHLFSAESLSAPSVDLTLGTDKLTQVAVDKVIGCSLEVFRASIYAGQDIMPDLPGMTDKQLKVLVEEAAGIDRLQLAHDIAKVKKGEAEKELSAAEGLHDRHESERNRLDGEFTNLVEKRDEWSSDRKAKIKSSTEIAKVLVIDVKSRKPVDTSDLIVEIEEFDKKLEGRSKEEEELERLNKRVAGCESDILLINSDTKTTMKLAKDKKVELDDVDNSIGKPCPDCGKPYEESDLTELKTLKKKSISNYIDRVKDLKLQLDVRSKALKAAVSVAAEFRASMTDVSKVVELQKKLRLEIDAANLANQHTQRLKENAKAEVEKIKELKAEVNPYKSLANDVEMKQFEVAKKCDEAWDDIDVKESAFNLTKEAVEVFGASGVRAHILDSVTPYLNDRTAHYLGSLSDGNIEAVWSTLTKTAKGDIREKFNIEVVNEKGAESFMGLSGGEKRKVRLATSMALQDMVASRASKPINLFIADEVDHALDGAGLERLMGILDEKARERGTVLVISHNELSDWIREQVMVTKKDGLSTVSGVLS